MTRVFFVIVEDRTAETSNSFEFDTEIHSTGDHYHFLTVGGLIIVYI